MAALPESWDVTGDSLAALLALDLCADELLLLKSISCPDGIDDQSAAEQGFVDSHFLELARPLNRIHWVNLRQPGKPRIEVRELKCSEGQPGWRRAFRSSIEGVETVGRTVADAACGV
jgi:hypothetical protein